MAKQKQSIRLPNTSQRIAIVGRTGSGKTQAALWHLSKMPLDEMPFVAINHKNEDKIDSIVGGRNITMDTVPEQPGLYRLHPLPNEGEQLNDYLWKLWDKENVGIYVDEGYMIDKEEAFQACLTQGRSKQIPMIILTQRPVRVSPFVFSECDFLQVFQLLKRVDKKTIEDNSPIDTVDTLKPYHSYYADMAHNRVDVFGPVPSMNVIKQRITDMLPERPRKYL